MRLFGLFFILTISLFALSSNQKVVIDEFPTKGDARKAYERYENNPNSIVSQYKNDTNIIIHFRKSGGRYIIAAEPFSNQQEAQAFIQKIAAHHPKAFVSQGIADDIQFLLMQHKNRLIQKPMDNEKAPDIIKSANSLSATPVPSVVTKVSLHNDTSWYLLWLLPSAIVSLLLFIFWRERSRRELIAAHHKLSLEKELMQSSIQAKNDFIAMMSHEIRAPINAVMGISHLVLESPLSVAQRSQITKIKDSAGLLLTLVNDILDHSKIEAGKVTIEQIPFDLNALLNDISNIVSHKSNEKGIELIFDIDRSVTSKLIGDPLRLFQVLVNLLNNAIKFTDQGSVILRARGQQISRLNLKIHFEVIDTGIGIHQEQIHRLFKAYTQADAATSRKYGGTGLGLVICKNLVSLMGGTIQVQSTPAQGSTFSFDIKLHSDSDFEKRHYRLPTADLMSKNALILDGNTDSSTVLQRGLEYFHYEVKQSINSLNAIALFKSYTFDIIFINTRVSLCEEFKKELQARIKNYGLKLVWMGEEMQNKGGFILLKPFNQLDIFNIILSVYGHMNQSGQHQINTKKLKENLKKFTNETLLLAEDNEINRSIIAGLLAGTNIQIITAETGKDAIEALDVNPDIRVILMDIQMPIMDGFEASKRIRQETKNDPIQIIAVTGNTLESDIQKISDAGMNGHIAKPIDVNTFYAALYYAFEKSLEHNKKAVTTLNIA
jgi:signal transduction histidine kinase/CheY-like chemotaxis protein